MKINSTVEWPEIRQGQKLHWLGTIKSIKGDTLKILRMDGELITLPKNEVREPGSKNPVASEIPKIPQPPHPNALLIQLLQANRLLTYRQELDLIEVALKLAVTQMQIDWPEDVEALFTPEQLQACHYGVAGFEGTNVEAMLHRAIFGPFAETVKTRQEAQKQKGKQKG